MKLSAKTIIVIGVVCATVFFGINFLLYKQPSLTSEAQQWLVEESVYDKPNINDSFYLWLGLKATKNIDPISLGKQIAETSTDEKSSTILLATKTPNLPSIFESGSLIELSKLSESQINQILESNFVYLDRYQKILEQPVTLANTTRTHFNISLDVELLIKLQKLQWLIWHNKLKNDADSEAIISEIQQQINLLRIQFKKTDTLLYKAVFRKLIEQHLKLHQELLALHSLPIINYPLLSKEEKSLRSALHGELLILKLQLNGLKERISAGKKPVFFGITLEGYTFKNPTSNFYFKPNLLVNINQPYYASIADISELPTEQIIDIYPTLKNPPELSIVYIAYDPASYLIAKNSSTEEFFLKTMLLHPITLDCKIDDFNRNHGKIPNSKQLKYCKN